MKRTIVQIIFFIYCIANVYPQYSTIWQLGKTDNSSKEFALAPDGKDRFIISGFGDNKKYFYAGEHTPADFPYIIPGPTAEWAGSSYWAGQCRIQLPILIKLSDVNPLKKYQWNIFIENVEYEDCMFLRVEVNGKNYDSPIKPDTKQLIYSIQPGILKEGYNKIVMQLFNGKSLTFDAICLNGPQETQINKIGDTPIISMKMADYEKMWEDLGMDVKNHDNLCQVLPTAVGDVFMTQENRPKAMDFWDMVIAEVHGIRPAELIEEQKKGRKVFGTFCVYVPDEVIIAANGIVTGLCGGSQFWVPDGEKVLPKNVCPLVKASVGARLGRTCPFFRIADMYIGETTCDGKKKAYEILGKDVPMHIMDIPQMKREKDIIKWKEEITDFAKIVEEFTGNKITPENLAEAINICNEKRKALQRVYDCRKSKCLPISGRDALLMTQISFFDDPVRCAQMCNRLADELEQRIKDGVSVVPEGTKRILITGTPLAVPNWKLHNIIETSGAAVVCEEMCTGTRYFENLVDESGETLDEQFMNLSKRYMKTNCACFTPNTGRIDDILRMVDEYQVDGVIDCSLMFCCLYDTEKLAVSEALKAKNIPVLSLETDYTDKDAEQLRTRIGAFVEMLNQ